MVPQQQTTALPTDLGMQTLGTDTQRSTAREAQVWRCPLTAADMLATELPHSNQSSTTVLQHSKCAAGMTKLGLSHLIICRQGKCQSITALIWISQGQARAQVRLLLARQTVEGHSTKSTSTGSATSPHMTAAGQQRDLKRGRQETLQDQLQSLMPLISPYR